MDTYTITIDDTTYDVVFTYRDPQDRLFLLLQNGEDTYVTGYEEDEQGHVSLFEADTFMIERILTAYNKMARDTYFHNGTPYIKQMEAAGMILAATADEEDVVHPFSKETRQPLHVDDMGLRFIEKIVKNSLKENHDVIMEAVPAVDDPARLHQDPICQLGEVQVFLDFRMQEHGRLIFVENGRPVVRQDRQKTLYRQFQDWERQEYEKALATRIENLV